MCITELLKKSIVAGVIGLSLFGSPMTTLADGSSGTGKTIAAEVIATNQEAADQEAANQEAANQEVTTSETTQAGTIKPEWKYVPVRRTNG